MNNKTIPVEKVWDGNERVREGRNGRLYTSQGRWQWVVGTQAFDTKREALAHLAATSGERRRTGEQATPPARPLRSRPP